MEDDPRIALKLLRLRLRDTYELILNYRPHIVRPPVIYPCTTPELRDERSPQQDSIPGFRKLKDSVRMDLDSLEKFLDDPESYRQPPPSTNAPYLIAVWNEVLCAPAPVDAIFKSMPLTRPSSATRRQRVGGSNNVKVDVITDSGKRWIRVNTVKNSRLLAEFREIDSYLTDSDDSSYERMEYSRPSLAQTEFDNSILRMGRSLIAAATANPVEATGEIPQVVLRLTRLDLSPANQSESDPRMTRTVQQLQEIGVHIMLGERKDDELSACILSKLAPPFSPTSSRPTIDINLDLSVLIALVSDITHAPLPANVEEANKRFIPPDSYREWKKKKKCSNVGESQVYVNETECTDLVVPDDYEKHSRALTNQLLQETENGILQVICDIAGKETRFWTTVEARDRCLRIIAKIGGPSERRRAHALFWTVSTLAQQVSSITEAEEIYWHGSRYTPKFISLFPIHLHPVTPNLNPSLLSAPGEDSGCEREPRFFKALVRVCERILAQDTVPHRRNLPSDVIPDNQPSSDAGEIKRANVTKANPRLTAHTVQSLLRGAERGWTTLTANKSSVKMILKEIVLSGVYGGLGVGTTDGEAKQGLDAAADDAIIWIVDPRSLAEGMSNQL